MSIRECRFSLYSSYLSVNFACYRVEILPGPAVPTSLLVSFLTQRVLYNKTNRRTDFQIYTGTKLYMFRAVSLPIIRSYPLYIRHWHIFHADPANTLSSNLYNLCQCRTYSGKLLMLGRETARNM
jgi:hypothetical protein